MINTIQKILNLSEKRIKWVIKNEEPWYKWPKTHINEIKWEIEEMEKEFKINNSVYLEDELWDIFWDYMCILDWLEQKWYINKEKVFKRCYKKFSKRLENIKKWILWDETKIKQKKELLKEHKEKYWS